MSATAEELPDVNSTMDETVVYEPQDQAGSGPSGPSGLSDMRQANASFQAGGRYTFGSGSRPLDGYTIKRAIGRGGFGEVYYATSDSGKEVALKLIMRNLDVERRGVMQCMNLKCPNLLTIFDLKENDAGDGFVVMEYVAGPSLASVLKQHPGGMPPAEVRRWLKGLVEGVAYLHDHGIVHRDLKPANLFMEEGIVKIGDYGLAKLITPSQGTEHSESIGTCHYMAPEIGSGKYNKPIDVYAIGIILYEMLTGRVPFDGETVNEVLMKHLTARPDVSVLPEPYRTIVARALAKDPERGRSGCTTCCRRRTRRGSRTSGSSARPRRAAAVPAQARMPAGRRRTSCGSRPRSRSSTSAPRPGRPAARRRRWRSSSAPPGGRCGGTCGRSGGRCAIRPATPPRDRAAATWSRPLISPAPQHRRPAPAPPVRRAVAPTPPPRPAPAPVPPPVPPEPPAMPSGRVRFAELAASMLWAAPMVALLAVPAGAALEIDPAQHPQQAAYVYLMALLGTWTAIIPGKVLETRRIDWASRRLIAAGAGWVTGFAGLYLARILKLDLPLQGDFFDKPLGLMPLYFAALYAIMAGWSPRTTRDRSSRFRLRTVLWTGLLAAALIPLWPYQRQDDIAIAAMIAAAVQIVSPWNEAAATYAKYVKATKKQKPQQRVA